MANFLNYFKAALIVQIFWSFSITLLISTIPAADLTYLTFVSDSPSASALDSVSEEMQDALTTSTTLPVVDSATLVFYSGNIILDLIGNFVTAIPQMITLLIVGLFKLFPIDVHLQDAVKYTAFAFIGILYLFSMLAFITNMRSGGSVI